MKRWPFEHFPQVENPFTHWVQALGFRFLRWKVSDLCGSRCKRRSGGIASCEGCRGGRWRFQLCSYARGNSRVPGPKNQVVIEVLWNRVGVEYGLAFGEFWVTEPWMKRTRRSQTQGNPINLPGDDQHCAWEETCKITSKSSKPSRIVFWTFELRGFVFWTSRLWPNLWTVFLMKKGRSIWSKAWSRWPMGQNLWDAFQVEIILHIELSENYIQHSDLRSAELHGFLCSSFGFWSAC